MVNTIVQSSGVVAPPTPHKVLRKNAANNQSRDGAKAKTKPRKKAVDEGHVDISV